MAELHSPSDNGAFAAPEPLPEADTATSAVEAPSSGPRRWTRGRRLAAGGAVAALALGAVATGVTVTRPAEPRFAAAAATVDNGGDPSPAPGTSAAPDWEQLYRDLYESLQQSPQRTTTQEPATAASHAESTGVVLIDTDLAYQGAEAAGSGMVLTSDGLILTNNHVVEGATDITVTVGTGGQTYAADVLGTDATEDVALLQLEDASGLATVTIDRDGVTAGEDVTAVGNAEGGGVLMAADGTVTQLDSSVTTSATSGAGSESLDGMIQFAADVVGGDSGGALLDDDGEVIGMTTAASSGRATTLAFAIPIDEALGVAAQIQAGDESGTVTIGYPAMLGVAIGEASVLAPGSSAGTAGAGTADAGTAGAGATVLGVYTGTPAAAVGLRAGDVITAIDGMAIADADDLSAVVARYSPDDSASVTWTTTDGTQQSADVTFIAGPAA